MRSEDLSTLFVDTASVVPEFPASNSRSGQVTAYDPTTGSSTILVDGVEMTDLAIDVVGAVPLKTGDMVRINTSDSRWYVMGIVTDPGAGVVPTWPADIAQAKADVAAAKIEVDAAAAAVAELNDVTLPALEAGVADAVADVANLTTTVIPALSADVAAAEASVAAVVGDVADVQADVATLTGTTLPALQAEVDGILPITETDISDDAITTPKIAANAVTAGEIAANAVTAVKINAGAVTTAKIDAGAVTTAELAAGAVTAVKIAADTITASQIAAGAVTASELAADAVIAGKIAAGTIVAADISSGAITTAKLAAGAVTANEIAAGAITTPKLAAGAITADKLSASYVYAGQLAVEQLQGGSLTADILLSSTIRTADTGARVEIGPFGIVTYAADNTPQTVLPSDAGGVNSFKGTIEASGATFTGGVSFRGSTEVASGGVITLASGVSTPQQAPTAVVDWETVALSSASHGIGWVWKDSKWWTVSWLDGGTYAYLASYHATTGALVDLIPLSGTDVYRPGGGLAWSGTYWYTVGQSLTDDNWYVLRWNTSGVLQNGSSYTPISSAGWYYEAYSVGSMQIAYRASTGQLAVVEYDPANQRFRVQYRDATTCATTSTTNTSVQAGFASPPGGVQFGSFDYGSERMVVASRNSTSVWVFNPASSYTYSVTDSFPAASGMITGLGWDGSAFSTARIFPDNSSLFNTYTAIGKAWTPTAAENTWWGRFTWNNASPAYTTTPSPAVQFTMKKRARFTLTTPDLPTGADTVKTYVGVGATEPANTSRWLQGTNGRSQTYTTLTTSGTNPPASGTFPATATPGKVQSSDGTSLVLTAASATLPATSATSLTVAGSAVRAPILVRRTTSQSVTNSATLVNDDTLVFNAEASAVYLVQAMVFVSQSTNTAAADFKIGLRVPAGASFNAAGPNPDPSITTSVSVGSGIWSALLGSSTGSITAGVASNVLPQATAVFINAVVVMAATAGVVGLTWAQNTATASVTTTVNPNSYLRAERF